MPQRRFNSRYRPYVNRFDRRRENIRPEPQRTMRNRRPKRQSPTDLTSGTASSDLLRALPIFPARYRCTLRYHEEELSTTSTTGVPNQYFFSANGVYDPNVTGTGHQPIGFDQMMLFFEQCTVVRSKISVDLLNSNSTVYSRFVLFLTPDTTVLTDANRIMENGQLRSTILSPNTTLGAVGSLHLDCNVATYFGRVRNLRSLLDDDNLYTTAAANPVEQVYYALGNWDPYGSTSLTAFFNVTIEYDVMFWEPRKLTES